MISELFGRIFWPILYEFFHVLVPRSCASSPFYSEGNAGEGYVPIGGQDFINAFEWVFWPLFLC